MTSPGLRSMMLAALTLVVALPTAAQTVALVGGGYGQYVRNSTIKKVLLPMDVPYEDLGESMDFSTLGDYALVIVAHGDAALREGQEGIGAAFDEYVHGGGHVLLIGNAPTELLGGRDLSDQPWIGAQAWVYASDAEPSSVAAPEHPWLAHLDPAARYFWLAGSQFLRGPTSAEVLIGSDDLIFMSRNDYGEGWTVFLSRGLFPYTREDVGPMREAQVEMLRKLVADAVAGPGGEIFTMTDLAAQMAGELARDPVFWRRDPDFGSKEGPQFRPVGPTAADLVTDLRADLARGERESVAVNLTSAAINGPVRVELAGLPEGAPKVEVRVMDRAPLIPWDKPDIEPYESPFWLMAPEDLEPIGAPEFLLQPGRTRVLWVQIHAPREAEPWRYGGAEPRAFSGSLRVLRGDEELAALPLTINVWPVTLPIDRPYKLKAWGFGAPDQRFWDEFGRQSAAAGYLSYPDLAQVTLPDQGMTLAEALQAHPGPFADPDHFPRLDFSYLDPIIGGQAAAGQAHICFQDVRTGTQVANAGTGLNLEWSDAVEAPEQWRALWSGYYRELMRYLRSRGFRRVEPIWTDEPTIETIERNYVPIAEMYLAAGMAPGSHWTTPGFMSPEQVNRFAHAVSDWSMYTIMMPKFNSYLREGSVRLREDAVIGHTRGGYGFAHRFPYANARRLGWGSWYYGGNFLRTGPVFKGWLYYLNYELYIRDEGVAGERLLAYGSAAPNDLSVPLLTCPDWEGARDSCDDISLVRLLEARLARARAAGDLPAVELDALAAELQGFLGADSPYNLHLEPRHYEHADMSYDYEVVVDASTQDMERAKRRILELLSKLPTPRGAERMVTWHEVTLNQGDFGLGPVHFGAGAQMAAEELVATLAREADLIFDDPQMGLEGRETAGIYLALADDPALPGLLDSRTWFPDVDLLAPGGYALLTSAETNAVAIIGGDDAGLRLGIAAFMTFIAEKP